MYIVEVTPTKGMAMTCLLGKIFEENIKKWSKLIAQKYT